MGSGPGVPKLLHHNGKVWCSLRTAVNLHTAHTVLHYVHANLLCED